MDKRASSIDAVILRVKDVPSGARLVSLLSAEEGIVEAFSFGGAKSRLRSHASPWHYGRAWLYNDRSKNFIKLEDFDPVNEFASLRSSLLSISAASFGSEFLLLTAALGGDWARAMELALGFFGSLDEKPDDESRVERATALFAIRAIEAMGLWHYGQACQVCAGTMARDDIQFYSRSRAGFVCGHCAGYDDIELLPGALAWLAAVRNKSFSDACKVGLGNMAGRCLKTMAMDMARKAVGSPIKSLESGLL